jgi:hypothetical protein
MVVSNVLAVDRIEGSGDQKATVPYNCRPE